MGGEVQVEPISAEDGMLLGAWRGENPIGYACLYWHFTSLVPAETVLMNDLYVAEEARGRGVGRALIEASAPGNIKAQRLYDATGAERSEWIEYELELGRPTR